MATSLTINDIRDGAFLSGAAYDQGQRVEDYLNSHSSGSGAQWHWINPAAFGSTRTNQHGYYEYRGSQVLLAYHDDPVQGRTLAVVFRGTDDWPDFVYDVANGGVYGFRSLYDANYKDFVTSVLNQAQALFGPSRILITGHSLGGAMAEIAMANTGSDQRYVGVTFGSAGDNGYGNGRGAVNNPGSDPRLINIGQVNPIGEIGTLSSTQTGNYLQGDPVYRSAIGERVLGSDIYVELPDEADHSLAYLASILGTAGTQHAITLYENTANAIAEELDRNLLNGRPFNVRNYDYHIGTQVSGNVLVGSARADVLIGDGLAEYLYAGSGNDILDGNGGDDRLEGGYGDDIIYGDSRPENRDAARRGTAGSDTAIFSYSRSQYSIRLEGDFMVVAGTGVASVDGTDRVYSDVENFQFYDGTRTRAQLLQEIQTQSQADSPTPAQTDTTAPRLIARTPTDNATGVSAGTLFTLTFDEPVFAGVGRVEIRRSDGLLVQSIDIADRSQVTISGSTVTINPTVDLANSTGYYINIASGAVRDRAGNAYAGISNQTDYNFTTGTAADTTRPILVGTTPRDNDIGVSTGASIALTFNEIMLAGTGAIEIHRADGSLFRSLSAFDASQVHFNSNVITLDPTGDFSAGTGYYVTVASNALRDIAGNYFTGISSTSELSFTTQSVVQSAPSTPPPPAPPSEERIYLSISDVTIREGASGTSTISFGVTLSGPGAGTRTVSVQWATQDIAGASAPATAGQDYIAASSVLVIPAGQTTGTIDVRVFGDTFQEQNEVFRVVLSQPSQGVTLTDSSGQAASSIIATGFITNDDAAPNNVPVTGIDIAIASPGVTLMMDVLANDSDPDGDALTLVSLSGLPNSATFAIVNNRVSVTPNVGTTGTFNFSYVADDGRGGQRGGFSNVIVGSAPGITYNGTLDGDIIVGTAGNDILSGGYGDDIIEAGAGSDRIDGGAGFNWLDVRQAPQAASMQLRDPWIFNDGYGYQDIITNIQGVLGTRFNDLIDAGFGSQAVILTGYRLYGNDGNDRLRSVGGDDVLEGGAGNDELWYGSGADRVYGGDGNDNIYAFDGTADAVSDLLDGGAGDDVLSSAASADMMFGGDGNDYLQFGDGDVVSGGSGNDTFRLGGGWGTAAPYRATITDLAPGDIIQFEMPNAVIIGFNAYWFMGPITAGTGSNVAANHIEYAQVNGATELYFGANATPGADFILSISGTFALEQFSVRNDRSLPTEIQILPSSAPPTVAADNHDVHQGEWIRLDQWVNYASPNARAATQYQFFDGGAAATSAYIYTPGNPHNPANVNITVAASDLANTWLQGGSAAGSETMWVRAFDGVTWSEWDQFAVTTVANAAPLASSSDHTLEAGEWSQVAPWVYFNDPDGTLATQYQFWDGGAGESSAYFYTPTNAHQAANTAITVAAGDMSGVWLRGGQSGGTETMFVRAFDGTDWSDWDQFALTTHGNTPPVATVNDRSLHTNEWLQVASLVSYSDAESSAATQYQFWDAGVGANSGYFYTPANDHWAANTAITVSAANLGSVWLRGGGSGGSETMFVRAYDGADWSEWDAFTLTTLPNTAPVATVDNLSLHTNEWTQLSSLVSYSDADGNAATRYEFWDAGVGAGSGYFYTPGNAHWAANTSIVVNASDLSNVWLRGAQAGGSETMFVRAYDGSDWSDWDAFSLTTQPNTAPVATINDHTLGVNQWAQLNSWLSYADADSNPATMYEFWDGGVGASSGYFYSSSNAHHAADSSIVIMASDLASVWVRGGAATGSETMFVRAFDGTDWSNWDSFRLTTS